MTTHYKKGDIVEEFKRGMLGYVKSYNEKSVFVTIRRDVYRPGGAKQPKVIENSKREWDLNYVRLIK